MNRLANQNLLLSIAVALFGCVFNAFGQDSLKPIQFEKVSVKRAFTLNTEVLSNVITAGKTTDKEKFDALLSWVVNHIKYDYRRYSSGMAFVSDRPLKYTLRRRKGICTDYAELMDSLCIYAGLQSVTISGYVKEVNFDVNDPVYFDNHMWNAVKLNGTWFLYDPTWCSGSVEWEYKRFAKWRIKMIKKLVKRTKKRELQFGAKIRNGDRCNLPKRTVYQSDTVDVIRFFPRVFIKLLRLFPFKMKEKFHAVGNSEYYLSNPEVFAVTHFPNNPIWSFSQRSANIADFVADEKSYNIPEYLDMDRSRHGTFCLECDDYEASGELEREAKNYYASLRNNPNNHFLPGNYHLLMSRHLFGEVIKETDSLTKIQLMDSTQNYLLEARGAYKRAQLDARTEASFHFRKNSAKKFQLLKENRSDLAELKKWMEFTARKRNLVRSLGVKSKSLNRTENTFLNRFNNGFSTDRQAKKMKPEQIQKMKLKIAGNKSYCDSLTNEIQLIQERFKSNLGNLWLNLRKELDLAGPMLSNYYVDGDMRALNLLDSYKFYIRKVRKRITDDKKLLESSIEMNVLDMADSVYTEYMHLVQMVKKRGAAFEKNKKNIRQLVRVGILAESDVRNFCRESSQAVTETICWNSENEVLVKGLVARFNYFAWVMKKSFQVIPWNSRMEQDRYKSIDHHIRRNQMRNKDAVLKNNKMVHSTNSKLYDYRKKWEKK